MTIHDSELLRRADEPTLGLKFIGVMPEDGTVTVLYPAVDTHDSLASSKGLRSLASIPLAKRGNLARRATYPFWEKAVAYRGPSFRYNPL